MGHEAFGIAYGFAEQVAGKPKVRGVSDPSTASN